MLEYMQHEAPSNAISQATQYVSYWKEEQGTAVPL